MTSQAPVCKISLKYQLISSSEIENACRCSVKHIPNPMMVAEVEIDDAVVILCPSALFNLQDLLNEYALTGGVPSGSITKHYGKYIRDLAASIY